MEYIDSNVFIFAALDKGERGTKARKKLEDVIEGKISAVTCALTVDEVLWILMRYVSREAAISEVEKMPAFPNLRIVGVQGKDTTAAIELMKKYAMLKPRDAFHLAVALSAGAFSIVSDDEDFKNIKEIRWMKL